MNAISKRALSIDVLHETLNYPLNTPMENLPLLDAGGGQPCGIEDAVPGLRRNRLAEAQVLEGRLGVGDARVDVHLAALHRDGAAADGSGGRLHHQAIDDAADAGQVQRQHQDQGQWQGEGQGQGHGQEAALPCGGHDADAQGGDGRLGYH